MKNSRLLLLAGSGLAIFGLTACSAADAVPSTAPADTAVEATLYDSLPAGIREKGEIVFVGDSHPPYRTVEADGSTISGIDADLQAALSEVLGVKIRMEISSGLAQMLTGMDSGRYDAFNGPLKATPERLEQYDGIAWLASPPAFLVPAGNEITSSGDLCGTSAAGVTGSASEASTASLSEWCVGQGKSEVTFVGLADTNSTVLAVAAGRAESVVTTVAGALDLMSAQPDEWAYVTLDAQQGGSPDQLMLLLPKGSELTPVMFEAFEAVFENGAYAELLAEWGLEDIAVEAPVLNPAL